MSHHQLLNKLWEGYTLLTPSALKIHQQLAERGDEVVNDHIAFRTFNDPRVGIDKMAHLFEVNGYEQKGEYHFEEKHLFAKHYEHITDKNAPKIFISELLLEAFSKSLQDEVLKIIDQIPEEQLLPQNLLFSGRTWENISYETYSSLRAESEYCAWLYSFGFCPNHFTVFVNPLQTIGSLEEMNALIKQNGWKMNTSGGEIKGTPEELLEQSSIVADRLEVAFSEGKFEVPSCYYEFARRYEDEYGQLYNGFIAKSADKIFESTDLVLQ